MNLNEHNELKNSAEVQKLGRLVCELNEPNELDELDERNERNEVIELR